METTKRHWVVFDGTLNIVVTKDEYFESYSDCKFIADFASVDAAFDFAEKENESV